MESINRAIAIIKPKQPFIDWINSEPSDTVKYTLETISQENLTFLIPEYDDPDDALRFIKKHFTSIFEFELFGWCTNEESWPANRTWKMFQEWFDVQIHSEVFDLLDENIEKEEM